MSVNGQLGCSTTLAAVDSYVAAFSLDNAISTNPSMTMERRGFRNDWYPLYFTAIHGLRTKSILAFWTLGWYYVGQTGQRLADRFAQHLRSIRLDDGKPVARHFNTPRHGGDVSYLQVFGLASVAGSAALRINVESRLIYKLGTLSPGGLNTRHDVCLP